MKCPLLAIGYLAIGDAMVAEKCGCLKKECAWWNEDFEECAMLEMASWFSVLACCLEDIRDKMPKWEQFGK